MSQKKRAKNHQSPYQKYAKAPYQYSEPYQQWRAAILRGARNAAAEQAARHEKLFGYGAYPRRPDFSVAA